MIKKQNVDHSGPITGFKYPYLSSLGMGNFNPRTILIYTFFVDYYSGSSKLPGPGWDEIKLRGTQPPLLYI